ncbi:MAG TPA: hypothetical protein VKY31_16005 [Terriglobia bacterium]|nr:hypothetical protein [Terriglobia bacterium]
MSGTIYTFDADTVNAFDKAYRLSRKPQVAAIRSIPVASTPTDPTGMQARIDKAQAVAAQGYVIDADLDVFEWDPYLIMRQRFLDGKSWVPSANQTGIGGGGPIPPGAISVPDMSLPLDQLLALYPPDPSNVPPPPAQPSTSPIGPAIGFSWPYQGKDLPGFYNADPKNSHFPPDYVYADPATGAKWAYFLLGTEMMSPKDRIGIWLLLPA